MFRHWRRLANEDTTDGNKPWEESVPVYLDQLSHGCHGCHLHSCISPLLLFCSLTHTCLCQIPYACCGKDKSLQRPVLHGRVGLKVFFAMLGTWQGIRNISIHFKLKHEQVSKGVVWTAGIWKENEGQPLISINFQVNIKQQRLLSVKNIPLSWSQKQDTFDTFCFSWIGFQQR